MLPPPASQQLIWMALPACPVLAVTSLPEVAVGVRNLPDSCCPGLKAAKRERLVSGEASGGTYGEGFLGVRQRERAISMCGGRAEMLMAGQHGTEQTKGP